jgi:hypothetical protein
VVNRNDAAAARHLRALFDAGTLAGLTDGQLLERFAERRERSAEAAFEMTSSVRS